MMKKIFPLFALACCLDLHACTIDIVADRKIINTLQNVWDTENFKVICQKLNKANAAVVVQGFAAVLGNVSVGWAAVNLKDRNTMVMTTEFAKSATHINDSVASIDNAERLLKDALNSALGTMNVDAAIQDLNKARRETRLTYGLRAK